MRLVSARTEGPSTLSFLTHVASCAANKEADALTRAPSRTVPSALERSALAAGMKNEISRWGLFDESHVELDMLGIFSDDRLVL